MCKEVRKRTQYMNEMIVEELNTGNIDKIQEMYLSFRAKSVIEYKFDIPPLDYDSFKTVIEQEIVNGFVLFEDNEAKGFLLYVKEAHNAIELNLIYTVDEENLRERRSKLLEAMMDKLIVRSDWNVISYPMLGVQETFVKDIVLHGFKLTGQAVVKIKFNDAISLHILNNLQIPDLPIGYTVASWDDKYFEDSIQIIHDTFKNANDALFDPRFLSFEGCADLIYRIVGNIFGSFIPEATTILLYDNQPAGICFANVTESYKANVPLIGVRKEHKNKGLGKYLLKNTVDKVVEMVKTGKVFATEINAGVDTDNFPAVRMYRKIGFKDDYTYPHAYYKNPNYKG
jgi:ribosomal protein S18 acetylase RimI-like enzyme